MNSAMIDIETLSLNPEAAVLSIGVAIFNEKEVIASDGWAADIANLSGEVNLKTVAWWMQPQCDAAREFSWTGKLSETSLAFQLKSYLAGYNMDNNEHAEVWANDPHFDYVILKQWWQRVMKEATFPIHYRSPCSYKTLMREAGRLGHDTKQFRGVYVAHNPIEDAVSQARCVIGARQLLGTK
jgi:hypothetical protein